MVLSRPSRIPSRKAGAGPDLVTQVNRRQTLKQASDRISLCERFPIDVLNRTGWFGPGAPAGRQG